MNSSTKKCLQKKSKWPNILHQFHQRVKQSIQLTIEITHEAIMRTNKQKYQWIREYNQIKKKQREFNKNKFFRTPKLQNIWFYNLQQLGIYMHSSMDSILTLHAPSLRKLQIDCITVYSIKSLRRCRFPKLQQLTLQCNKDLDFSPLVEFDWNTFGQLQIVKYAKIYENKKIKMFWIINVQFDLFGQQNTILLKMKQISLCKVCSSFTNL